MIHNKSVRIIHNMIGKARERFCVDRTDILKTSHLKNVLAIMSVIIIGSVMGGGCNGKL